MLMNSAVKNASFSGVTNGLATSVAIRWAPWGMRSTRGLASSAYRWLATGTSASSTNNRTTMARRSRVRSSIRWENRPSSIASSADGPGSAAVMRFFRGRPGCAVGKRQHVASRVGLTAFGACRLGFGETVAQALAGLSHVVTGVTQVVAGAADVATRGTKIVANAVVRGTGVLGGLAQGALDLFG